MEIKDLMPWTSKDFGRITADNPLMAVHRDIDRVFDGFFRQFGKGFGVFGNGAGTPRTDVAETDKAYEVSIELPGLEQKDIEVSVTDDVLTVKGEKKHEHEEKRKDYYLSERSYGSLFRSIPLPGGVDNEKVDARFKNGVLTVTLPKTAEAQSKVKRIAVKGS